MSIESRSSQYGKVFDHWQIRELLGTGSGGKSAVFRMVHTASTGVECALKVISLLEERGRFEDLTDFRKEEYRKVREEFTASAEQEVLMMHDLQGNTNVVDYLDHTYVDWQNATGFGRDMLIRMEKLTDLRGELSRGRFFSSAETLQVGLDICTALTLCHSRGIMHRDIKPENIFINKYGHYKLGDFGVSRILDTSSFKASTGIGTPQYWAPEQISGNYDQRIDIYSLGLVLYELSNRNRLPFATSSYVREAEIQQRMLGTPLPKPADADDALAQVILKACAPRPGDRYATAEDFLNALNRISVSGGTGKAPISSTGTRPSGNQTVPASARKEPYRTAPAAAQKATYGTAPAASGQDSYKTAPAAGKDRFGTVPASAGKEQYGTVPASVGSGRYGTAPATAAERNGYGTVPAAGSSSAPVNTGAGKKKFPFWPLIAAAAVVLVLIINPFEKEEEGDTGPEQTAAPTVSATVSVPDPTEPPVETAPPIPKPDPVYINYLPYYDKYGKLWLHENMQYSTGNNLYYDYSATGHLVEEVRDNLGNVYQYGLHMDGEGVGPFYITYALEGKYTSFTGTCVSPQKLAGTDGSKYFEVFCDGMLVYTSSTMYSGSAPQDFSIDVTGVQQLTIQYPPTRGSNEMALVCDGLLQ